jgi:hypothetical protein
MAPSLAVQKMRRNEDFESRAQEWLAPPKAAPPKGRYGISYWRHNRPTRFFGSLEEMERARLEFIRSRAGRLNLIRLARETKYYVDGRNVPNRV